MSEISNFINRKLGRTSSKLSGSFAKYLDKNSRDWRDNESNWIDIFETYFPFWIKNVQQKPPSAKEIVFKFEDKEITVPKLYNIISRQQDEIKALKNEIAVLKRQNHKYQAPPQKVLEALAIYGD